MVMTIQLGQHIDKQPHVIYSTSKTLNNAQINYSTTKVNIFSNHVSLRYLITKKDAKTISMETLS